MLPASVTFVSQRATARVTSGFRATRQHQTDFGKWQLAQRLHTRRSASRGSSALPSAGRRARIMGGTNSGVDAGGSKPADARPEDLMGQPLIFGPPVESQAAESTQTLLVLLPGALIPAEEYRALAEALQAVIGVRVRLTVVVVDINWRAAGFNPMVTSKEFVAAAVDGAIAAAAEHIQLQKSPSGRQEEVFVAGHSLMGVAAVRYALEQAGGLVLLGGAMLPATSGLLPTARTWTRPILQVSAELDGKQYLSKQTFSVLTAAESAAKLGLRHAATFQPAIVLSGVNHSQFAGGEEIKLAPDAPPLDLQPDVSQGEAVQQTAELLANFLVVHRSRSAEDVDPAADALVQWQLESAALVDAFLTALGRGSPAAALQELQGDPHSPDPQAAVDANIIPGGCGGEVLRDDEQSRRWLAHPGELAAAEAFAAEVQRGAVPDGLRDRVVVAATAHTDETTFLYNQPTIDALPGGRVLVHVHVHLWRHALETRERIQPAVAPEYAIKLRTASAICRALGEDDEAERQTSSHISGQKTNEATFEEALRLVTPAVRERYQRRGKQAGFGADVSDAASPMVWVQQQRVRFQDASERETLITSPTVNTQKDGEPVPKLDSYSRGGGRFAGNHYIKVVSLARAVEWLMTDTLRPAKLQ